MIRRSLSVVFLAGLFVAGCHNTPNRTPQSLETSSYKSYHLRGKVVATNAATSEVTLSHEAIPGFMEAMTMPYKLKDSSILGELHAGDIITADLLVSQHADADVLLDHVVVVAQGKPDYRPKVAYHVPAPGDEVPDFKLQNQDGHSIHFDQFRGEQLLVTFIYTRCPLPNFCPRVTRQFAEVNHQLAANPALYKNTHLLCVSFDPINDTPPRLRAYGATYMGTGSSQAFAHWDFAVPDKPELDKLALFFDVGVTRDADDAITHTLSTTLIGADGKVLHFYPGNDWTVDQVVADMKQAAGA